MALMKVGRHDEVQKAAKKDVFLDPKRAKQILQYLSREGK